MPVGKHYCLRTHGQVDLRSPGNIVDRICNPKVYSEVSAPAPHASVVRR